MNDKQLRDLVDPRVRMLQLYEAWVRCLPHQVGKRMLVQRSMVHCKNAIRLRQAASSSIARQASR